MIIEHRRSEGTPPNCGYDGLTAHGLRINPVAAHLPFEISDYPRNPPCPWDSCLDERPRVEGYALWRAGNGRLLTSCSKFYGLATLPNTVSV